MAKSPLNRTTAPQVVRLFDLCFKHGVEDACNYSDDIAVREWLEERLADGGYGLISEIDTPFDWKRWRHVLYHWCRVGKLGSLGDSYIDVVHRFQSTSAFAVLPIAMRFYLMGIQEWLEYPNPNNMVLFKQIKKIHWKPVPDYLRTFRTGDYISLIQDFIYERVQKGYNEDLSQSRYDGFANGIWRCTRKYLVYGEDSEDY